ncbi:MAG: thioredoxin family protein [Saprospiraceae bacterium]|nr:thioredoxin family protein [Saprospiraceae bacterium]
MRKLTILVSLLLLTISNDIYGQILNPVKWSWKAEKINETEYNLVFHAKIDKTWAVYSQFIGEDGPVPTSFTFNEGNHFKLIGKANESKNVETKFDKVFEMTIKKFHNYADFTQKIKILDKTKPVEGYVTYMTCDDTRCLPPTEVDFKFDSGTWGNTAGSNESGVSKKKITDQSKVQNASDDQLSSDINAAGTGRGQQKISMQEGSDPVKWNIELQKLNQKQFILRYTANISKGWNVYSIYTEDNGPVPTSLIFESKDGIELSGKPVEKGQLKEGMDKMFGVNVKKFYPDQPYIIEQKISVTDITKPVNGLISYQACDDEKCILLEQDFAFDLQNEKVIEFSPETGANAVAGELNPVTKHKFDKEFINTECGGVTSVPEEKTQNWWLIFLAGFVGGLLAFLTPCVFPMVPLTVSFFTKRSGTRAKGIRNAIYYGLSIIIIYLILGLVITAVFGADALNQLSTNAWFNIGFAVLFIIFGISFFGFFEIQLPSSWANKSDSMAGKGGLLGIFFMAFTLALVSFSCTGPIIGTLLVETATGGGPTLFGTIPIGPLVGMFGFSLALALPFGLFALFPAWLNSLPKSGSWMNVIKVTLGFIEIALALKFISIADLTMNWKIMPYELFVGLWVLIAGAMAVYYFGWLRFPSDPPKQKISPARKIFGTLMVLLMLYMASGFRVSKVSETFITPNLLSGLAPPAGHSYIFPKHCPLNINCFHDYDEGIAYAKKVNKPVLLDFTGYGCVNCRRMEDNVWSKDQVFRLINDEYVLISLYVDDRKPLEETYMSTFSNKEIKEVGKKWADFQAIHFETNSQPYYVLSSPDGKILSKPVAYTPDIEQYRMFLQCGLDKFEELKK